ncbi:MAG: M16 family metallopeptidase [Paracoccaceae bacterium]
MRRLLIAAVALLGLGGGLGATASAAVEIQELVSETGVPFWLVEEDAVPIVAVEIEFTGGARLDPQDRAGLANMLAGLLDKGSGDLDAVAFSDRSDEIGARLGFGAGRDSVSASARMLAEDPVPGAELLNLALTEPRFDADAVERARGRILSSIASDETDPSAVASKAWFARAFPDHPYGRPSDGTAESVAAISVEDLRAGHTRLLTRARATVAIVGAIGAAEAKALVDRIFAGIPEGETPAPVDEAPAPPAGIEVIGLDVPQSVAVFGHPGIPRDDPDFFAAFVVNHVLGGGGFSSRLMQEVREERGLAYGVYASLADLDAADLVIGRVQTQNARMAESLDVIRDEWRRIAEAGLSAEDLDKAKRYLTGAFPLRFDSNAKIAGYLVFLQKEGLGAAYLTERNDRVEAVTLEDAARVARRLYDADALSIVVVGEPAGL